MSRVYIDHALLNGKATRPTCIAEHPKTSVELPYTS